MAIRLAVNISESLYRELRERAERSGTSINALIVRALEHTYDELLEGKYVTGPMIKGKVPRGPRFPTDENPHDLVFP